MQSQRQKQRQWQRIESTCFNPSDPCSLVHSSTSSLCPTRSGASPTQGTICHKTFCRKKRRPGEETRRVLPSLYNVMSNESKIKCVFFSPRKLEKSIRKSLCREKLNYERWSEERVAESANCWIEAEMLKNSDPMYNCVSLSASVWYTTKTKMLTMDIFVIQIQSASVQYTTKRTMCPVYIYVIHPDTKYRGVMQNDSKLCHRQSILLLCILSVAVSSVIHRCWFTTFWHTILRPANRYPLTLCPM